MRLLALIILLAIIISLGSALRYLVSDDEKTGRVLRMLTWRIGLSVGLFVLLMAAWYFGLIQPHGILPG
ncbi:MAG: twin transmembrane helix small protein [Gammaproteobacteria bacterium]|nr:twin transmembrane helix small protein [Pseudomonadota bacterium]MCZ6537797.1 twin transmembrane helix small protein [Gammaproteobacteria bacterium]MCZ6763227.1 twin transmembrane helix small protein [Gammaproteobacteria bacterium]MCZ6826845.1 twin transmembrane helix small protein [Gammaproteobacteria bacterium]MCZ6879946.1 twin transmembrane helix small protein [Gammaproteobacteria bacterium]